MKLRIIDQKFLFLKFNLPACQVNLMEIIKNYLQRSQNLLNQLRDYKYNKFRPKANNAISELFNNKLSSPKDDKYIICEAL